MIAAARISVLLVESNTDGRHSRCCVAVLEWDTGDEVKSDER